LIDEQQEHITSMQNELETLKSTASEAVKMKKDYTILQKKCLEYELSLEEIGKQLHESVKQIYYCWLCCDNICVFSSKLEVDNLRENSGRLREAVWTSDSGATNCTQCSKRFSVSRRRVCTPTVFTTYMDFTDQLLQNPLLYNYLSLRAVGLTLDQFKYQL